MTMRYSDGTRKKIMDTGSFRTIFTLCFIDIYTGTRPASANDAIPAGAVKLGTVTKDGDTVTGLSWSATAPAGVISKAAEVWRATGLAAGVAGWFRMREAGDPGTAASTTAARGDGVVATSGAELSVSSTNVAVGVPIDISAATFTAPVEI